MSLVIRQHAASIYASVCLFCLFFRFVCPKKCVCSFVGLHCGCIPYPPVIICVSIHRVTLWVLPPLCVFVQLVTLWVHPLLVCVLSLEDNLCWILACCLLCFAAFFYLRRRSRDMTFSSFDAWVIFHFDAAFLIIGAPRGGHSINQSIFISAYLSKLIILNAKGYMLPPIVDNN